MEVRFLNKEIANLYESGKTRKNKLDKIVIHSFFEVIASLCAANNIYDLRKEPSLNFERLKKFKNRYSLRLTKKYRLEVEIEWEDNEKLKGIIGIDKISVHYH